MPDQNWEKLKEIFHAAVALPPNERAAYLDEVCNGNVSLHTAVQSLLKSHEETSTFVDTPAYQAAAAMLTHEDELTGQTIAHYRIRSLLGAGGMGKVYLAEDEKLKRNVALKVLPSISTGDQAARERLLREAQAAAALDHPNICGIYEVGDVDGTSYIAMQHIDGETLCARLQRGPLSCNDVLAIAAQIADALVEAHSNKLVHRDIKPANIILNRRGQVKVLDFGLAKITRDPSLVQTEAETEKLLSTPGTVIGTVPYMSPEQVKGESLDARSDIFSFGVVLYEMLSGCQLFAAGNAVATISAILTKEPDALKTYGVACPENLEQVVRNCLAKDRERRYQSMREVATDLEIVRRTFGNATAEVLEIGDGGSEIKTTAPITGNTERTSLLNSRRFRVLVVVAMLVSVTSVYLLFFTGSRGAPISTGKSVNFPAYDYYLRGKVNVGSENRENNEAAIKLLKEAIAADPNFAPAYAELARAYVIKSFQFASAEEQKQLNEDAEVAVEKALTLNPELPEGHFARGHLLWTPAQGFPHELAIQSYKRSLALNPKLDEAHHQLGMIYTHIGLLDKSRNEIEKAIAINPANTLARFRLAVVNLYQGKYEEAVATLKTIPHDANPAHLDRTMATALFQLGRTEEATDIVEKYLQAYPTDEGGNVTSVKAMLQAKAGQQREAEETIQRAVEIGKGYGHFHHTAFNIALAYSLLNKPDQTIKWLQVAADDGFPCYPLFANDPNLNNVRKDQRFVTFMGKLKQQWERYSSTL